jgi:hypothetical protein
LARRDAFAIADTDGSTDRHADGSANSHADRNANGFTDSRQRMQQRVAG